MENNKSIFKVGDKVFDIRFGWGTIISTEYNCDYPIDVKFYKSTANYTAEGKYFMDDIVPSLSFTEYTFEGFSQERPDDMLKYGKFSYEKDGDYFVIDELVDYDDTDEEPFKANNGNWYPFFEPLTNEQLKTLGLENGK